MLILTSNNMVPDVIIILCCPCNFLSVSILIDLFCTSTGWVINSYYTMNLLCKRGNPFGLHDTLQPRYVFRGLEER